MRIIILKIVIKEIKIYPANPVIFIEIIISKVNIIDLKKTVYLKTPIIEKECKIKLGMDIFEGPKYREPLIELISFNVLIFFFRVPEKLDHNED